MPGVNESVVLVGGGGGVYRIAKFLKHIRKNITTIQTVFDHGGHSGALRDERGVLPPGDIRQSIVALSHDNLEPTLRKLMSFRFEEKGNSTLNKAPVGNILLAALTEIEGSLPLAINALCELCGVEGKVLPVSLDDAELCVKLNDGTNIRGENNIDMRPISDDRTIVRAFLEPKAKIYTEAYDALVNAEKIVLCPGDLYTSLIPNFLVEGFVEAINKSKAKIIYITNLMTKKSETHEFKTADFARIIYEYLGKKVDVNICNNEEILPEIVSLYAKEQAEPVTINKEKTLQYVEEVLEAPLSDSDGHLVRHHERIASIIADL